MIKYETPLQDEFTATQEGLLEWHRERTIVDVTELVCELMERTGVNRTELADRLGKSKGHVSQLLDGFHNMRLGTVSDLFTVLGYEFRPACKPIKSDGRKTLRVVVALPEGDGAACFDDYEWPESPSEVEAPVPSRAVAK